MYACVYVNFAYNMKIKCFAQTETKQKQTSININHKQYKNSSKCQRSKVNMMQKTCVRAVCGGKVGKNQVTLRV